MPPALERSFPGEMLSAFRAWLGLSQDDVACILGIATRSVQTYEGQGGPEWLRYALLGWAVVVHGETPRATARCLGFPWEHFPLPDPNPPDDQTLARLIDLGGPTGGASGPADDEPGEDADGLPGEDREAENGSPAAAGVAGPAGWDGAGPASPVVSRRAGRGRRHGG